MSSRNFSNWLCDNDRETISYIHDDEVIYHYDYHDLLDDEKADSIHRFLFNSTVLTYKEYYAFKDACSYIRARYLDTLRSKRE